MASLKDVTLRIPDAWSANWFRSFVVEYLAKADVRNALGDGVTVSSDGNSVATISTSASVTAALDAHVGDPLTHPLVIAAHESKFNPHPQYAFRSASTVADASGGATVDTECRAQLNALLAVLRASGAITG